MKIVCLGSSAGGLAPTIQFFKHMEPNTGMAFVVIQHLNAGSPSLTPEILSIITPMKVSAAIDQERVLLNRVYTIKPNTQLTIRNDLFQVSARTESPYRHKPFDRFLKSLAHNSGEHAIAVVLSGYDGDGSAGFIAIKAHGGVTYAQDRSSLVSEMPKHAIQTGCVDHVLSPTDIAEAISARNRAE